MLYPLQKLDNFTLLNKTKSLADTERKITLEVLHHLREISRRRLYALRGFNSIFDYATKELGYSAASAQRRLSAMRLLAEIPEAEDKIQSGELTLTNVAQAQKLFNSESNAGKPFNKEEKKEILATLENKSTRDAEKDLLKHSSQPISLQKPDLVKPLTPTHSEIRFLADQDLMDKLDLIRGFLASKKSSLTLAELFGEMAKLSLAKLQPKEPKEVMKSEALRTEANPHSRPIISEAPSQPELKSQLQAKPARRSRYIPVDIKRTVYYRDGGSCSYVDPLTHRRCGSRRAVQYDHIVPFAQGGEHSVENIRIICSIHNRVLAIHSYGKDKMAPFLRF